METISTSRRIRSGTQQTARCSRSKKKQTAQRTRRNAADGFLTHRFLPLYAPAEDTPDQKRAGQGCMKSLSALAGAYGCELMNVQDKPYPYNILLTHWDMGRQLMDKSRATISIMEDENGTINAVTIDTYEMNQTLNYIPVLPLYKLLRNKMRKRAGELLLSVFAYLYHEAGIPYYRDSCTPMDYNYEMLYEWYAQERESYEETDFNTMLSDFRAVVHYGDVMLRKIYNRYHLKQFNARVHRFAPRDDFDRDCMHIARAALQLHERYPEQSVFRHIAPIEDDEAYDGGVIRAEEWTSFVADTRGWLYEQLEQTVNNQFQECGYVEEPKLVTIFDKPNTAIETLDFEHALFELIGDLCTLLNNMP